MEPPVQVAWLKPVSWMEPYRLSFRRNLKALRFVGMFTPRFWIRVTAVGAVLFAFIPAIPIALVVPVAALPWGRFALMLVMAPLAVFLYCLLLSCLPRSVKITPRWTNIVDGQHGHRVRGDQLIGFSIRRFAGLPPCLELRYRGRKNSEKCRVTRVWMPARVDQRAVLNLLDHQQTQGASATAQTRLAATP